MFRKCFALAFLFLSVQASADNTMTVYVLDPLKPIKWTSPRAVAWSTLKSEIKKRRGGHHSVGHASVDIYCEPEGREKAIDFTTAMTTAPDVDEKDWILKNKVGLAVLFTPSKGRLEDTAEVRSVLTPEFETGRVRFIQYKISRNTCKRLARYFVEFIEKGYDKNYGYPSQPRRGKGAGCTTYAYSFLEVAGLWTPEFERTFKKTIRVPMRLIGSPLTEERVGVTRLLLDPHDHWAKPGEPYKSYVVKDAGWFHSWIDQTWENGGRSRSYQFTPVMKKNARGLFFDASDRPDVREPIWLD